MRILRNTIIIYVVLTSFCLFALGYKTCNAEISPVLSAKDYGKNWQDVQQQLESQIIAQVLTDYGMKTDEVHSILQQLNQEEVHKLALNINQVVPTGDSVAIIIGILIVVILVIVILKLMNKEIIVR
ncbi:MAG: hypothetical protein A2Y62_14010 [Candidatus Fischerbacteria bacterium RBG_13_37_8]|uniref:Uncharacterized protein n=1 Tax=Candidatus Fischerbacteria bacterium RBG_13_37_8 TaxID=1817863 RepID=A0A1F5VG68_9BACT|nr:MAG: hypothetical protein A2Y62_14010 [Candidatus Fischerbacteria bacterium RBG_13_37_8]